MGIDICWFAQCIAAVPRDDEWLSESEVRIAAGLRFPKRRADWRLGRWTAKRALAIYAGLSSDARTLARIEVRPASTGAPQPYLDGERANAALSISHSHGIGFCIVAPMGTALGCDIEYSEPRSKSFLDDYFSPDEQARIGRYGPRKKAELSTVTWSAKESTLKAIECGLRSPLLSVQVALETADRSPCWLGMVTRRSRLSFQGWWRKTGDFVWTIVASPAPRIPILLS